MAKKDQNQGKLFDVKKPPPKPKPCAHSWQHTSPHQIRCTKCGTTRTT